LLYACKQKQSGGLKTMIDKLFEHIPYDFLRDVKFFHLLSAGAVIGVLLFTGYYFTLYQNTHEELENLQTQRAQTAQKLKNYKQMVAQKDSIAKNLARMTGRLDALKQQLPREKDLPRLLKEVSGFGSRRATFDITRFQLENGKVEDFYKEIPVAIQMQGSFWDTLDFLDKMQNRLQLVNFSDLKMDLKTGPTTGQSQALFTNITASTYAYIEGSETKVAGVPNNSTKPSNAAKKKKSSKKKKSAKKK
jgi:type IV pilus assembly protein PilO